MDTKCGICLETYTKATRVKITCHHCPVGACRTCQQTYLVNTYDDPHCYSCKQGWGTEFLAASFPMSFRNKTLRQHRRKILLEREKSLLPAMQIFVEAKKIHDNAQILSLELYQNTIAKRTDLNTLRVKSYTIRSKSAILWTKSQTAVLSDEETVEYEQLKERAQRYTKREDDYFINEFRPAMEVYRDIRYKADYWLRIFETGEIPGDHKKERREFLMRCPSEDCRGFLSTAYKCGTCEKKTCADCLEILTEGVEHTCVPDSVETAKAIKKETRPCPKCGVRIYKIDGCDQMWCTLEGCNTAFSWDTGTIVVGRVHNPHYYEWLRRKGASGAEGAIPREVGDIPCGGLPDIYTFSQRIIVNNNIPLTTKNVILEIHRNITEFQDRLQEFPQRPPALFNKDANVAYLMNELTEVEWMTRLEHAEARFNRKREIGQILQTLVAAATDILQVVYQMLLNPANDEIVGNWLDMEALPNFEGLRLYTNESFEKLSTSTRMAVPLISDRWAWVPIRAIYKRAKNVIVGTEEGTDESV